MCPARAQPTVVLYFYTAPPPHTTTPTAAVTNPQSARPDEVLSTEPLRTRLRARPHARTHAPRNPSSSSGATRAGRTRPPVVTHDGVSRPDCGAGSVPCLASEMRQAPAASPRGEPRLRRFSNLAAVAATTDPRVRFPAAAAAASERSGERHRNRSGAQGKPSSSGGSPKGCRDPPLSGGGGLVGHAGQPLHHRSLLPPPPQR